MSPSLPIALGLLLAYCLAMLAGNFLLRKGQQTGRERYDILAGVVIFVVGIAGCGIFVPLYLIKAGWFAASFLPARPGLTVAAAGMAILFGGAPYISTLVKRKVSVGKLGLLFLGPIAMHFSYWPLWAGLLFPSVAAFTGPLGAAVIGGVLFALYHQVHFHNFPPGRKLDMQFELAVYGTAFLLFYHWSDSLLLTFVVQHCLAVLGIAYKEHWDFAEVDEPFYFSLVVFVAAMVYGLW